MLQSPSLVRHRLNARVVSSMLTRGLRTQVAGVFWPDECAGVGAVDVDPH